MNELIPQLHPPFTVFPPRGKETPVVVEVPHAGLGLPAPALATLMAPARSLARDADLYVDELFSDAPQEGATLIVSHVSRYICDLNRAETDIDHRAAEGGTARNAPHGLVWLSTTDGTPALSRSLSRAELAARLDQLYRPYHRALAELLETKRRRFGYATLLCGHSMPSRGKSHHDPERADIVPGSRGRTSAAASVIDCPDQLARELGWTVEHDTPYRGGFTTAHYGDPRSHVHAVQVELARRLYMDERSLNKFPNKFRTLKKYCRILVTRLGKLKLRSR